MKWLFLPASPWILLSSFCPLPPGGKSLEPGFGPQLPAVEDSAEGLKGWGWHFCKKKNQPLHLPVATSDSGFWRGFTVTWTVMIIANDQTRTIRSPLDHCIAPAIFSQCATAHWRAMNDLQVCCRTEGEGHLLGRGPLEDVISLPKKWWAFSIAKKPLMVCPENLSALSVCHEIKNCMGHLSAHFNCMLLWQPILAEMKILLLEHNTPFVDSVVLTKVVTCHTNHVRPGSSVFNNNRNHKN